MDDISQQALNSVEWSKAQLVALMKQEVELKEAIKSNESAKKKAARNFDSSELGVLVLESKCLNDANLKMNQDRVALVHRISWNHMQNASTLLLRVCLFWTFLRTFTLFRKWDVGLLVSTWLPYARGLIALSFGCSQFILTQQFFVSELIWCEGLVIYYITSPIPQNAFTATLSLIEFYAFYSGICFLVSSGNLFLQFFTALVVIITGFEICAAIQLKVQKY